MPNTNRPSGFTPVRRLSGGLFDISSCVKMKKEASVVMCIGDPVVRTGTAEAVTGIPLVTCAVGSEGTPGTVTGVVVAIDPIRSNLYQKYLGTGDTGYVFVCCDPDVVYEIQENALGPLAITDVGNGVNFTWTAGDTTLGLSKVVLKGDGGSAGTQCKILQLVQRPDNALGIYARWEVMIDKSTDRATSTLI